ALFIHGVGAPPPTLLPELTPSPQRACYAGGLGLRVSPSALLPERTPSPQRACYAGGLGLRVSPRRSSTDALSGGVETRSGGRVTRRAPVGGSAKSRRRERGVSLPPPEAGSDVAEDALDDVHV